TIKRNDAEVSIKQIWHCTIGAYRRLIHSRSEQIRWVECPCTRNGHVSGRFGLMAAGRPGKNPLARYCWAPFEVSNLRQSAVTERRFPPPWSVQEQEACYVVRDHGGQARRDADQQPSCSARMRREAAGANTLLTSQPSGW